MTTYFENFLILQKKILYEDMTTCFENFLILQESLISCSII